MRVHTDIEEGETGVIWKTAYQVVVLRVEFSEEECAIIEQKKIQEMVVLERDPDMLASVYENDRPEKFFLYIGDLLKG